MAYYNTTSAKNSDLKIYREKAASQEDLILKFFRDQGPNCAFSPSYIQQQVLPSAPITSVRRAMSDLTDSNKLVKLDYKTKGVYGRLEHCWRLLA